MNRVASNSPAPAGRSFAPALAAVMGLSGCAPFDVNVGTDEPLKVDLSMEVHVYQHGEKDEEAEQARANYKEVLKSRRDRGAEIQELKDNRVVGETHRGLLEIRNLPGGDWGRRAEVAVKAENEDREFLIRHEAAQKGVSEDEIRRIQWRHWQRKSFPGEWVEVEGETLGQFVWIQKPEASEGDESEGEAEGDAADSESQPED